MDKTEVRPPRAIRFTIDDPAMIEDMSSHAMQRKPYATNGGEYLILSMTLQSRGWDGVATAEVELSLIRSISNG